MRDVLQTLMNPWPSEGVASVILGFRLVNQGSERFRHLTWVTQDLAIQKVVKKCW